jgi:hypothetical protein
MVNDRFRAASIYGFEMVDAAPDSLAGFFRRQSNIYAESDHRDFSRIFRKFSTPLPQCKHLRFIERC